jgi:hypothetical protein
MAVEDTIISENPLVIKLGGDPGLNMESANKPRTCILSNAFINPTEKAPFLIS